MFSIAFEALDNATVTFLTSEEGLEDLTNILLYHVAPGIVLSEAVMDGEVTMVNGANVTAMVPGFNMTNVTAVSRQSKSIMINDAQVTSADILVNNGVIHVIDSVLIPPTEVAAADEPEMLESDQPEEVEDSKNDKDDKDDKDDEDDED